MLVIYVSYLVQEWNWLVGPWKDFWMGFTIWIIHPSRCLAPYMYFACLPDGSSYLLTCTWGGIHPEQVEPESPRENHCVSWVVSTLRSPVPASLQLLALQLKPSLSGLRAPEHPLFTSSLLVFNPGDARDRNLIGRGVLITPPFVKPFSSSVGAQSTTQPCRAGPLTPRWTIGIWKGLRSVVPVLAMCDRRRSGC